MNSIGAVAKDLRCLGKMILCWKIGDWSAPGPKRATASIEQVRPLWSSRACVVGFSLDQIK